MVKVEKRNPSVEALRCLLMFLIVVYHAFWHGIWGRCTELWTNIFLVLMIWHVDAFIGISGWFGMRFAPSKVLRLIGIMAWYSVMSIVYLLWMGGLSLKCIRISGGWFGETYLFFLCMIPFVNAAIEKLTEGTKRRVLVFWVVLAIAYVITWLPVCCLLPFSPSGMGIGGQSIFLFFFIYTTMRLIRISKVESRFAQIKLSLFLFVIVQLACGGVAVAYRAWQGMELQGRNWSAWAGYDAPHVWLFAICVVAYFATKVRLPTWMTRFVMIISPSMFGVYLMHDTTSFGRRIYTTIEKMLDSATEFHPVVIILISAVVCFSICLVADLIRRLVVRCFNNQTTRLYDWVDSCVIQGPHAFCGDRPRKPQ